MARSAKRLIALALATAVVATACSGGSSKSASSKETTPTAVFNASTERAFVDDLASVGVATYTTPTGTVMKAVTQPASPLRLTKEQADNAALGVATHTGMSVAGLDLVAPLAPLAKGARPLPASLLLAGWLKGLNTPSAKLARKWMGPIDWTQPNALVFPQAVLMLFASDIAVMANQTKDDWQAAPAALVEGGPNAVLLATPGLCTTFKNFIDGTIEAFFKFIGHVRPDDEFINEHFSGALNTIIHTGADIFSFLANLAIDTLHEIVINGVKMAIAVVTNAVAEVATVAGIVSQIALSLQPWAGEITGDPDRNRKAVGNESGRPGDFTVTVKTVIPTIDEWPSEIRSCAEVLNVPLPKLKPNNADVTWNITGQLPSDLIVKTSDTGALDDHAQATLRYETTSESEETHDHGKADFGWVFPTAVVHRKDIDELQEKVTSSLLAQLPEIVQKYLGGVIRSILSAVLDQITKRISQVRDPAIGRFAVKVDYHDPPDPERKPENQAYSITIPGGPGVGVPYLELKSCTGIRGPWAGRLYGGTSPTDPFTRVNFTLDQAMKSRWANGIHTNTPDDSGNMVEIARNWNVPVAVNEKATPPTMNFAGATNHVHEVIHTKGGGSLPPIDGTAAFRILQPGKAWPLTVKAKC